MRTHERTHARAHVHSSRSRAQTPTPTCTHTRIHTHTHLVLADRCCAPRRVFNQAGVPDAWAIHSGLTLQAPVLIGPPLPGPLLCPGPAVPGPYTQPAPPAPSQQLGPGASHLTRPSGMTGPCGPAPAPGLEAQQGVGADVCFTFACGQRLLAHAALLASSVPLAARAEQALRECAQARLLSADPGRAQMRADSSAGLASTPARPTTPEGEVPHGGVAAAQHSAACAPAPALRPPAGSFPSSSSVFTIPMGGAVPPLAFSSLLRMLYTGSCSWAAAGQQGQALLQLARALQLPACVALLSGDGSGRGMGGGKGRGRGGICSSPEHRGGPNLPRADAVLPPLPCHTAQLLPRLAVPLFMGGQEGECRACGSSSSSSSACSTHSGSEASIPEGQHTSSSSEGASSGEEEEQVEGEEEGREQAGHDSSHTAVCAGKLGQARAPRSSRRPAAPAHQPAHPPPSLQQLPLQQPQGHGVYYGTLQGVVHQQPEPWPARAPKQERGHHHRRRHCQRRQQEQEFQQQQQQQQQQKQQQHAHPPLLPLLEAATAWYTSPAFGAARLPRTILCEVCSLGAGAGAPAIDSPAPAGGVCCSSARAGGSLGSGARAAWELPQVDFTHDVLVAVPPMRLEASQGRPRSSSLGQVPTRTRGAHSSLPQPQPPAGPAPHPAALLLPAHKLLLSSGGGDVMQVRCGAHACS